MLDLPSGPRQLQHVPEVQAHPVAGRVALALGGNLLSAYEDVGVVPVDEYSIQFRSLPFPASRRSDSQRPSQ